MVSVIYYGNNCWIVVPIYLDPMQIKKLKIADIFYVYDCCCIVNNYSFIYVCFI